MSVRTGLLAQLILSVVFGILSAASIVATVLLVQISRAAIAVGNEPHKADEVNGLFGALGYGILFVTAVPAILAIVFGALCVMFARKWRKF